MVDPPLPRRSQRIQEICERLHEYFDQLKSLPPVDQNIRLRSSRRDTPLPFSHIDLKCPFVHRRMNPETSQPSSPITYDKESSTSHPIVGDSLPSSFPYVLISPVDTNPTMLSSLSTEWRP